MTPRLSSVALLLTSAALSLALSGCGTRTVETRIIDRSGIEVFLRHRLEGGVEVARGYAHPLQISPERLAAILSKIDMESEVRSGALRLKKEKRRRPAIEAQLLEPMTTALVEALAQADPNQEVVVRAVWRGARLGIFVRRFVTSFTAFAEGDELHLDFALVDWQVPIRDEDSEEDESLPMPQRGEQAMPFRILPGPGRPFTRAAGGGRELGRPDLWQRPSGAAARSHPRG